MFQRFIETQHKHTHICPNTSIPWFCRSQTRKTILNSCKFEVTFKSKTRLADVFDLKALLKPFYLLPFVSFNDSYAIGPI